MALIVTRDRLPEKYLDEIEDAGDRAVSVGAQEPLQYVGMGATGIVFCGAEERAWKCGRIRKAQVRSLYEPEEHYRNMLGDEYEFLRDACHVPSLRRSIACPYAFHEGAVVIERQCPTPRDYGKVNESRLFDLFKRIRETMRPHGWQGLEFKTDGFVVTDHGPVLVDAGFSSRVGWKLVRHVEDLLNGSRVVDSWTRIPDLDWNMRMDALEGLIPMSVYQQMSRKLRAAFPKEHWT